MILYIADRYLNILGVASNTLPGTWTIKDDKTTLDLSSGVATLECDIVYPEGKAAEAEKITKPGNYILKQSRKERDSQFLTIIESEEDSGDGTINIYAEDAGLDLLNEIAQKYEAEEAHPVAFYIEKYAYDSGFEIGVNEIADRSRKLKWDGEQTCAERLRSVATQFDAELSYSFKVEGLHVTHKFINIWKRRGMDNGVILSPDQEIDSITVKRSIADLATGLMPTGGTPEGTQTPISLIGYSYDDGDIYVEKESGFVLCRSALEKWTRYHIENGKDVGHIMRTYTYDTTSQAELLAHAVAELKAIDDMSVEYDAKLAYLPDNVAIGDYVTIVDHDRDIYVKSRVTKLEISEGTGDVKATFGEQKNSSGGSLHGSSGSTAQPFYVPDPLIVGNLTVEKQSNMAMLTGGEEIPTGADLNNYYTPGTYYCVHPVNNKNLKNCPEKEMGFRMFIHNASNQKRGDGDHYSIEQIIVTYAKFQIYMRWYENGWGSWFLVHDSVWEEKLQPSIISKTFTSVSKVWNTGQWEISYSVPSGYQYLAVTNIRTSGFVAVSYCVSHDDGKLKGWTHGQAGTGTYSADVLFIRTTNAL